jgi:hypothetical protein
MDKTLAHGSDPRGVEPKRAVVLLAILSALAACGGGSPTGPARHTTQTFSGRATHDSPGVAVINLDSGPVVATVTWSVVKPGSNPPPSVAITVSEPGSDSVDGNSGTSTSPETFTTTEFSAAGGVLHVNVWVDAYTLVDTGAAIDYVLSVSFLTAQ